MYASDLILIFLLWTALFWSAFCLYDMTKLMWQSRRAATRQDPTLIGALIAGVAAARRPTADPDSAVQKGITK